MNRKERRAAARTVYTSPGGKKMSPFEFRLRSGDKTRYVKEREELKERLESGEIEKFDSARRLRITERRAAQEK